VPNSKAGGPMQLEPNPVFSIIDAQMEKMNKTAKEREDAYGGSRGGDQDIMI